MGLTTAIAAAMALPALGSAADVLCLYEGRHYSPGALAIMGRVEMVCTADSGVGRWARSEPTAWETGNTGDTGE